FGLARLQRIQERQSYSRNGFPFQDADRFRQLLDPGVCIGQKLLLGAKCRLPKRELLDGASKLRRSVQDRRQLEKSLRIDRATLRLRDHSLERRPLAANVIECGFLLEVARRNWVARGESRTDSRGGSSRKRDCVDA